jgi:hypothetical protein
LAAEKMKGDIHVKADVLKTIMSQDRQEIQALRASVYNVISALTLASFALTSFFFRATPPPRSIHLTTDLLLVLFIWMIYIRLRHDLYEARKGLVARQRLITALDDNPGDLDPFPDARRVVPDIHDGDLWWIPMAGTVAILIKAIVLTVWRV